MAGDFNQIGERVKLAVLEKTKRQKVRDHRERNQ
jgi:hypothetical protein